jgi:serine/threonine protein kinase
VRTDRSAGPGLPQVDGYTVEALIDTGGFSRVYRATQHGLDRAVAIKVLNSSFEDERQQRTFERECKVMGQLSTHQNIVTVFESASTADGHPSIVMELYEGTYRADEQLSIAEVVDVGAKVADALQAIHDRGIVHRDIKPHNIFISQHGQPAIGDFGISSIESERTVTGGAGFSINYAPPEVFEEGGAGAAGDVYSLGATLYQLASGEVPFPYSGDPAERMRSTVHKIITAPPPSLRRPDAPEELDRLLRRCMAKHPVDRPASAADVALELRRIQANVGSPGIRSRSTPSGGRRDEPVDQTIDRRAAFTDNVTVARDRPRKEVDDRVDDADGDRSLANGTRRWVLVGAAFGLVAILASGLYILLGRSDGSSATPASTAPNTVSVQSFTVLSPPTDLTVGRSEDGSYELTWSSPQEDVGFQVHLVGSSENRFTSESSYSWGSDDITGSGCFEVRTVNAERTRISQSAAGPVCASG